MPTQPFNKLARYWRLRLVGKPLVCADGWLHYAIQDDEPVVIKLLNDHGEKIRITALLKNWQGNGVVTLMGDHDHALLLKRMTPGTALVEFTLAGQDDFATDIFCDAAHSLHHAPSTRKDLLIPLGTLFSGFAAYKKTGTKTIPADDINLAEAIYLHLLNTQNGLVALHGDLHHGNIIHDSKDAWRVIDPKGYRGEPAYEAGAWLRNPMGQLNGPQIAKLFEARIVKICTRLGFDRRRVTCWAYAQAVLATIWALEDQQDTEPFLAVTAALKPFVMDVMVGGEGFEPPTNPL